MTVRQISGRLDWLRDAIQRDTDHCIEWPFARVKGYGAVWYEGRVRRASHIALILDGRQPPKHPFHTRHLCNNPPCVNPRHLMVGTNADNQNDRLTAGTSNRGERNGRRRLTWPDVRAIRARYRKGNRWRPGNGDVLAAEFGIARKHLDKIIHRTTWVDDPNESKDERCPGSLSAPESMRLVRDGRIACGDCGSWVVVSQHPDGGAGAFLDVHDRRVTR